MFDAAYKNAFYLMYFGIYSGYVVIKNKANQNHTLYVVNSKSKCIEVVRMIIIMWIQLNIMHLSLYPLKVGRPSVVQVKGAGC